jgi:NitT/TauT family transport system substrate-binding protein
MRTIPNAPLRRLVAALAFSPLVLAAAACGGDSGASENAAGSSGSGDATASELRLGYFANLTHAPALIAENEGYFEDELGDTKLTTQVFNAGPDEVEALFAGALDAAYIGPSPTINAYGQSDGDAIRIIAGAASGGAQLVVRDGIESADDLEGTTLASPQLGNTQDVALRTWLTAQGLENDVEGGGDVTVAPTKNSDVAAAFDNGDVDGAWLPEPYASQLVLEHGAHVLVDEQDLWPDGQFVTTHLVVRTEFLEQYPGTVQALLQAHVTAVELAESDEDAAKKAVNAGLVTAGGKELDAGVLDRAWGEMTVTYDPIASALKTSAENAVTAGTAEQEVDLSGIYDLRLLNKILEAEGRDPASAGGLGNE